MRSEDEVPVTHLVVDATGFIKNAPLIDIGANIYSVPGVVSEIRDSQTRERMKALPYELKLKEPSSESFIMVREISKKTGDYAALSIPDLKLLALAHDLHVQFAGKESINYAVKSIVEISNDASSAKAEEEKVPFGFVETSGKSNLQNAEDEPCSDDELGWVDETNIASVLGDNSTTEKVETKLPVAVLSSDFAIQNVIMHMKMNLISMDGLIIKTLKSYVLHCRSCRNVTTNMTKKFCPKCGNDSLNRVAASVDESGKLTLHIDWQKLNSTRGLKRVQKTIKGGKHDDCDQFFEDQRMPKNLPARKENDPLCDNPFQMHDVSSRSAVLGIRAGRNNNRRRHLLNMLYYCYSCQRTVHAEADQSLRCSQCHSEFIEEANVPDDQLSDDQEESGVDIHDFFRFISNNMNTAQSQQQPQNASYQPSSSSRPQPSSSGRGFFGNLLSNLVQQSNNSSTSSGPQPNTTNSNNQRQQNQGPQSNEPMMDFMNQLFANLASNAGPGVRVQLHFGEPPVHGNINNYVFGDSAFDQLISQLLNQTELVQQGLSDEDMAKLPKSRITNEQRERELQCTTCMETFELDEEVTVLPCKHVFHETCIFPWLKKQRTCPICRQELERSPPKKETSKMVDIDELD
ncbi:RING-type E3 ubiquitin transferase [Aphelenchoides bicaudatus]|nr:RING-type E3 ubiquitin transferase [Aphelenchoides bicaudatus]